MRRPISVSSDQAAEAVDSLIGLSSEALISDPSACACVVSCLEVITSITGALPRSAAALLFVESGGLRLCAWALGRAATAVAASTPESTVVVVESVAESAASGEAFCRRLGALCSAIVMNVIAECPEMCVDVFKALSGESLARRHDAIGLEYIRNHIGDIPEVQRMLRRIT